MAKIKITTPQFERNWDLDFEYIPQSAEEFIDTVTNAPTYILKGLGFCLWGTINSIARENAQKPKHEVVSIPALELTDGGISPSKTPFTIDIGHGDNPTKEQDIDQEIWLIPGEWYNIIPEGFILTCITGKEEPFKAEKTDNDIRFGCLAYGIKRQLI